MKPQSTTPQPEAPAPKNKFFGQKTKAEKYLEWVNDWLTIDAMADNYGMTKDEMLDIIEAGKIEHHSATPIVIASPAPISREVEGFTPGEWEAKYNTELFPGQAAIYGNDGDENGRVIAVMDTSDETDTANIDLVCSAPTLYRENQQLKDEINHLKDINKLDNYLLKDSDKTVQQQAKDIELLREALRGMIVHVEWREDFVIEDAEEGNTNCYTVAVEALKQTEPK